MCAGIGLSLTLLKVYDLRTYSRMWGVEKEHKEEEEVEKERKKEGRKERKKEIKKERKKEKDHHRVSCLSPTRDEVCTVRMS